MIRGDGCSDACRIETGWVCDRVTQECEPECGDAIRVSIEACDDGNLINGDGCDSSCRLEGPQWLCQSYVLALDSTTSVCEPVCGDQVVTGAETCDDGNTVDGDGCSAACQVELGYWLTRYGQSQFHTGSSRRLGFAMQQEEASVIHSTGSPYPLSLTTVSGKGLY